MIAPCRKAIFPNDIVFNMRTSVRAEIHVRLLVLALLSSPLWGQASLLFRDCRIVDGVGNPEFRGDALVVGDSIDAVGERLEAEAERIIECGGRVLAPGFIDLHNHSVEGLLQEPSAEALVSQGITTILLGADGSSPFPPAAYRRKIEETGTAVHVGLMVGHGTLRRMVMGDDYRRAAVDSELKAMAALLQLGLEQGAFGLSAGLEYDPGFFSATAELIALASGLPAYGGFYMPHIRDEEEEILEALEESVDIARQSGAPLHISHLKLGNRSVSGKTNEALEILSQARDEGIDVTADVYPYAAWASTIAVLIPSRQYEDLNEIRAAFERAGGASNIVITRFQANPEWEFKSIQAIAVEQDRAPEEVFLEIWRSGGASIIGHTMTWEDVKSFYLWPWTMVASDGGLDSRHPRKAGTFPRVLARLVREEPLLTLEEAIHKMTGMPAARLGWTDRGRIAPGCRADLVLFAPDAVTDRATFENPDALSAGIDLTLVAGVPVWSDGAVTMQLPGKVLRNRANLEQASALSTEPAPRQPGKTGRW